MISYYCLLVLYLTWLRYHIFDRRPAAHTGAGICWIAYPRGLVHTPWLTQINDYTSTDSASCNSCCAVCVVYNEMTILISARWSATSFSFLTCQVSLPCSILLRTRLLYNARTFHCLVRVAVNPLQPKLPKTFWTDASASCEKCEAAFTFYVDMMLFTEFYWF